MFTLRRHTLHHAPPDSQVLEPTESHFTTIDRVVCVEIYFGEGDMEYKQIRVLKNWQACTINYRHEPHKRILTRQYKNRGKILLREVAKHKPSKGGGMGLS